MVLKRRNTTKLNRQNTCACYANGWRYVHLALQRLEDFIQQLGRKSNMSLLFDVNTGGGESAAGIHLYNTVKDLTKPSVAQFIQWHQLDIWLYYPQKKDSIIPMSRVGSYWGYYLLMVRDAVVRISGQS